MQMLIEAPPPRLVIGDGVGQPGWPVLGEGGDEIVIGAVGKFWRPASLSVTPDRNRSLVSYECRTLITDPVSRRRFRRYWWLIHPFVAHILAATVQTIKADAEVTGCDVTRSARRPACGERSDGIGQVWSIGDGRLRGGCDVHQPGVVHTMSSRPSSPTRSSTAWVACSGSVISASTTSAVQPA